MDKKTPWIVAVGLLAAVVALVVVWQATRNESGTIRLGATLPLTGDAAAWGKNTQQGVDLAVEEINARGGVLGRQITVIYEDTQALPKEGVTAYRKLTTVDGVQAIIDDSISGVTLAMAPLAESDKVVVLATGATAPKISEAGDFIFRIWNSDAYEGEVAADFAYKTLGLRSVAVLYINNDYGTGLEQVFRRHFTSLGGNIAAAEGFNQGSTDVRTQITKIVSSKPDGLYLVGYPKEIPVALRQAREQGLDVPLLGTVAMHDPDLIKSAGDAAEGLMFPYPKPPTGEHVDRFRNAFEKNYGSDPGITADVGYDAAMMLAKAMELSGGTSGDDIRRGLMMIKDYPGVSGTMTFDEKGDVHKPMGMIEVIDGEFQWKKL